MGARNPRSDFRALASSLVCVALVLACRALSPDEIRALAERNASQHLADLAQERGSLEAFERIDVAARGPHLILTYRSHHPEWFLRSHDRSIVTCNARTGRVLSLHRPGS